MNLFFSILTFCLAVFMTAPFAPLMAQHNGPGGAESVDTVQFQLCAEFWTDGRPVKGATLIFQPNNPAFPYSPLIYNLDTSQSCTTISVVLSDYLPGTTFSYAATLPDTGYLNGVNSVDLCQISHHILGLDPLTTFAMLAADANKSSSITTFDIVEYRKLIFGLYDILPNNTSWRFIADYCDFPNPNNPFMGSCATGISSTELEALDGGIARVIGIKNGDVNGDARLTGEAGIALPPVDSVTLLLPLGQVPAGVPVTIPVRFDQDFEFSGLQVAFHLDPALVRFDSISSGLVDVIPSMFYYNPANSNLTFTMISVQELFATVGTPLFKLHLTVLQPTALDSTIYVIHNDPNIRTYTLGSDCEIHYSISSAYHDFVPTFTPVSAGIRVQPPSPNPFGTQTIINLELEKAETAQLEIRDLTGRILYSNETALPAGHNRWDIEGSWMPSGGLAIWTLRIGGRTVSGKLLRQ